jgi:enamine deaminase RidA (YjgF/YER057c/UK114 family)
VPDTTSAAKPNIQHFNPDSLGKPLAAYSNITRVKTSELLFVAGQVGLDKDGKAPTDFDAQCALVFANIGAALASQGAGFANIVSFTSYLVHSQDIPKFAQYRAREFPRLFSGGAYPPNTLLIIDRLVREDLLVEVAAVAAL